MTEVTARSASEVGAFARRSALRTGPRPFLILLAGLMLLGVLALLDMMYGSVTLSAREVWSGLTSDSDVFAHNVVWQIRYPRFLDGLMVGAALAVSGAMLQGVTRNPLADPTILGVTAAAGLASATAIVINPQIPQWGIAASCVGGGLVGGGVLFVIAWRGQVSPVRLALAGVALSAFFGAAIVGLLSSSRTFLQTSLGFLAGGLYGSDWSDFRAAVPYLVPGLLAALLLSSRLNVLALGDEQALAVPVLAFVQLANQLQLLVVGAGDHPCCLFWSAVSSPGTKKRAVKRPARESGVLDAARRPHPPGLAPRIGGTHRGR